MVYEKGEPILQDFKIFHLKHFMRIGFALILLCPLFLSATSTERINVNSGVSFPADANYNSAAIYGRGNPGALKDAISTLDIRSGFGHDAIEGEAIYTGSLDILGYYIGGGVNNIDEAEGQFFLSGGVGFRFISFGVGAGVLYSDVTKTAELDLGVHWGWRESFAAGLTVSGLLHNSARSWALGVGYREPGKFLFAADIVFHPAEEGNFDDIIYIDPMATLEWTEYLTIGVGYMIRVSGPSLKAFSDFHGEVNWWVLSMLGLNYKYQNGNQEHTVSVKLII